MSLFSERLKHHIEESQMTVYALAKKASINRPMVHKAQQGDKIPGDAFIIALADAMMLTNDETKELLTLASRARIGEPLFQKREAVRNIIDHLCDLEALDYVVLSKDDEEIELNDDTTIIEGNEKVASMVYYALEKAASNTPEDTVYFYLPETAGRLFSIIHKVWRNHVADGMTLVQSIGMEKEYHHTNASIHNLKMLGYMLDFCLDDHQGYQAFYHYLDYPEPNESIGMPYYLLTSQSVMLIAKDGQTAISHRGQKLLHFFRQRILTALNESRSMVSIIDDPMQMEFMYDMANVVMEPIPCVSTCLTKDIIERYVPRYIPGREQLVNVADHVYSQYRMREERLVNFFHLERIEEFLDTGWLPTFPRYVVDCIGEEDRLNFMESVANDIESGKEPNFYALNEDKFKNKFTGEIVITEGNQLSFHRMTADHMAVQSITITEPNVNEAFIDFFDSLKDSEYVLPREETVTTIRAMIEARRA